MSRDITPGSPGMVSKSDTKEPNNVSPSDTNRGIMQFCQTRSVLVAAFVSDLDTPTAPGSSARLEPHGRPFTDITVTRAHPDPDGTPHLTPPPRPPRGPSWCCRAGPTSTDQVAGSCGQSRSDSLVP